MVILTFGNYEVAIKFFVISIGVLFLFYAYSRNIFYIKPYLILSILLAFFQFYFTFFNPFFAKAIGPTAIAQTVWGDFATPTFTNFYTIFWFPRVSGLSREAGFLASFIVAYILFLYLDNKSKKINTSFLFKAFLMVGYVLSLSKMSLVLFGAFMLNAIKRLINKVPFFIAIACFVFSLMFFWTNNTWYLLEPSNESFLHRFGGYVVLPDLNLIQLLFGISDSSEIRTTLGNDVNSRFHFYAGFSGFIIQNGVFVLILTLVGLYIAGVSTSGILILLILTLGVQLDTNQNFVVLTYFLVLKFYSNRKIFWNVLR